MRAIPSTIEEIYEGQEYSETRAISAQLVGAFTDLTEDDAPIHKDDQFAVANGYKARIAHSFLLASGYSKLLGTVLPGPNTVVHSFNLSMCAPAYINDILTWRVFVRRVSPSIGAVHLGLETTNQNGELLNTGRATCVFCS